ncbi:MAG TPA: hypothetical protein VFP34_07395 [Microlunatus sp.]|nr:hypothetical protein [Microlunatus sp.]
MSYDTGRSTGDAGRILSWVGGWLAMTAMLVLAPLFLASGLMAPAWGVVVIVGVWVALFVLGILLMVKRRPVWVVPIPIAAALLWWLLLSLGEHFLGWSA